MSNLIKSEDIIAVCQLGKGKDCCRYLGGAAQGFECLKHTEFKQAIDQRFAAGTMNAQGDNCEGLEP